MQERPARKSLISFFLYVKSGSRSQPALDKIAVLALYAVAAAFFISSLANIVPAISNGRIASMTFLLSYMALTLAALLVFWKTRRLAAGKIILGLAVLVLLAEQIVDVGGNYGLGVLYLMLGFPALYLLLGLKASASFLVLYDAAVGYRIMTGSLSFSPRSILNYPGVPARVVVILVVAAVMQLLICGCLEFLMRHFIRLAYYDAVSGLPNRYKIGSILEGQISVYARKAARVSVIAVKMLNLGSANASLGSDQADLLLKEIGTRLLSHAGEGDSVGRWSSSIFLVITRIVDPGGLEARSRELIERLARPYLAGGRPVSAFFTLAVSRHPDDASSAEELVSNVVSLLAGGEKRPGEIRFFDGKALRLQQQRYALMDDLDSADYDRDFRLVYQPIMSLPKARCVGAEILLRWKGRDGEDVPPNLFIPIAEESGAIRKITHWVIRRGVADLSGADLDKVPGASFSINLSVLDLRDKDFPDFIQRCLAESSCPGLRLEFEITERVMLDDDPRTRQNIERLLADGFSLSIDDFGTGYSSLSYLHTINARCIKIDQSFVRGLASEEGREENPVIEAIISMSKSMKLESIAEGVEKAEQLEYLISHGCDMAQGYLFSPGMPFASFLEFFKANRT
jgi:EAL domain-containing protein (putative c-di-GMP-specific phosphodiesterase class I)/GGDEF domain-containing protein